MTNPTKCVHCLAGGQTTLTGHSPKYSPKLSLHLCAICAGLYNAFNQALDEKYNNICDSADEGYQKRNKREHEATAAWIASIPLGRLSK